MRNWCISRAGEVIWEGGAGLGEVLWAWVVTCDTDGALRAGWACCSAARTSSLVTIERALGLARLPDCQIAHRLHMGHYRRHAYG